jgi:molybdopterin-guanine dinucleotide biosynthesis protein A
MIDRSRVAGVVLAGGLSRRMGGGAKALRPLAGRPMLAWVIERMVPQCDILCLNANGDPAPYAVFGLPVVPDDVPGALGPLAGVLAGLDWAAAVHPGITHLASVPCDSPFLPHDLVDRLVAAANSVGHDFACAGSGGRSHPVVGLWPVAARTALHEALVGDGLRKIDAWTAGYGVAEAAFATVPFDPFLNANTPEDLVAAEAIAATV